MDIRETARVVVINKDNEILLMQIKQPDGFGSPSHPRGEPLWITIGGKIELGESREEAAQRELFEEASITDALILTPPLWYGEHVIHLAGKPTLLKETFFMARVTSSHVSEEALNADERGFFCAHKWWSLEELQASKELFTPSGFPHLVEPILQKNFVPKTTLVIAIQKTPELI